MFFVLSEKSLKICFR